MNRFLGFVVQDCHSSINFQVAHIFYEGNQVADSLSKVVVEIPEVTWLDNLPE